MSLDYSGIPNLDRNRKVFTEVPTRNQLDSALSKESPSVDEEDILFDDVIRTFLKGEALKEAIGNMDPNGFIPVEEESSVRASIQRLFPDSSPSVITFGMFKEACDAVAQANLNLNEDWILKYNITDPKLDHAAVITKFKDIDKSGNDWITAFLDMLSPFAGILIAGALNDIWLLASKSMGIDTHGDTGEIKSFAAGGVPFAIALLVEIGWTLYEFNALFKDSKLPEDIKNNIEKMSSDPKERRRILEENGIDYSKMQRNQRYNDYEAIRNYSLTYIQRHQDNLNYHHWVCYSQVAESQVLTRSAASMAPAFSDKWRKLYKIGSTGVAQASTTITEVGEENILTPEAVPYVKSAINTKLSGYIKSLNSKFNTAYNEIYQSLNFEIDPCLVCCLVHFFGKMNTDILKRLSTLLRIAGLSFTASLAEILARLMEGFIIGILNMLVSYLSQLIDSLVRKISAELQEVLPLFNDSRWRCLGIPPIMLGIDIAVEYIFEIFIDILKALEGVIIALESGSKNWALNSASSKLLATMAVWIDKLANKIDSAQTLCSIESSIDDATSDTLVSIAIDMDKLYPVMKMAEEEKRKHFADIPSIDLEYLGTEIPGTDSNGNKKYSKPIPDCFDDQVMQFNISMGAKITDIVNATPTSN